MHVPTLSSASILRGILLLAAVATFGATQAGGPNLVSHLYRMQLSTGQIVSSTWHGTRVSGATELAEARGKEWTLIGVSKVDRNGTKRLVYSNKSSSALEVSFYKRGVFMGSAPMARLEPGWTGQAVADIDGDGNLDVVATHEGAGEVGVYFFGGLQGTALLRSETISSLSAPGWNVVGAADLNGDGHPDLILQESSTREVMLAYLEASNGITVTGTQVLSGKDFRGWTAAGMQDMNGDGHPDLILSNDANGQAEVNYYAGRLGVDYLGSESVDQSSATDWKLVVPSTLGKTTADGTSSNSDLVASASLTSDTTAIADSTAIPQATTLIATSTTSATSTASTPVLIFNGTGTNSNAVAAIENVVHSVGLSYHTINSSGLNSITQAKLATYRLFIVPGGNSITIGKYLTSSATTRVRSAVSQNGLNYLGMCAGGFFGAFSSYYKALNLTSGVWFKFYADYYKGIHKESVMISFPARSKLDIYWENGPALSGWGKVVGKYPNGTPAITEGYWGKGFVLLSGVHPEAPSSWRNGMSFSTPVDVDIAYAGTLVKAALNRTMLPHY